MLSVNSEKFTKNSPENEYVINIHQECLSSNIDPNILKDSWTLVSLKKKRDEASWVGKMHGSIGLLGNVSTLRIKINPPEQFNNPLKSLGEFNYTRMFLITNLTNKASYKQEVKIPIDFIQGQSLSDLDTHEIGKIDDSWQLELTLKYDQIIMTNVEKQNKTKLPETVDLLMNVVYQSQEITKDDRARK